MRTNERLAEIERANQERLRAKHRVTAGVESIMGVEAPEPFCEFSGPMVAQAVGNELATRNRLFISHPKGTAKLAAALTRN